MVEHASPNVQVHVAAPPKQQVPDSIPVEFLCPISRNVMVEPVILGDTGHTFDREHIEKWLSMSDPYGPWVCPLTNKVFYERPCLPANYIMRSLLERMYGHINESSTEQCTAEIDEATFTTGNVAAIQTDNSGSEDSGTSSDTVSSNTLGSALTSGCKSTGKAAIYDESVSARLLHLSKGTPDEQLEAATFFASLSENRGKRTVLGEMPGLLSALVKGLSLPHDATQLQSLKALKNFVSNHDQNKRRVVAITGAVPVLVDLLTNNCPEAKSCAAQTLACLASNVEDNSRTICGTQDAISSLFALLEQGTPELQEQAANCIANLAYGLPENQLSITLNYQVHHSLATLLKSQHEGVSHQAARALANLAHNNKKSTKHIAACGGVVNNLVSLLCNGSRTCREHAACALAIVAQEQVAVNRMSDRLPETVPAVMDLLKFDTTSPENGVSFIVNIACAFISNVASCNQRVKEAFGATIPSLVAALQSGQTRVQEFVASALSRLADGSRRNQELISQHSDVFLTLGNLLCSDNLVAQEQAAWALRTLTTDNVDNATMLAAVPRVFDMLVGVLRGSSESAREDAATILGNLAKSSGNREAIGKVPGAFPLLVHMLRDGGKTAGTTAARTLAILSKDSVNKSAVQNTPGAVLLLKQMTQHGDRAGRKYAWQTINNVTVYQSLGVCLTKSLSCFRLGH